MKTLKQIREGRFVGGRVSKLGMSLPDKDGKSAKWVGKLPKIGYKIGVDEHKGKPWSWEVKGKKPYIPGAFQGDPAIRQIDGDDTYDPMHWKGGGRYGPSVSAIKEVFLIFKNEDDAEAFNDEILGSIMAADDNYHRMQGSSIMVYESSQNIKRETERVKNAKGPFNIAPLLGSVEHMKEILKRNKWPQPDGYGEVSNPIPGNVRRQGLKDLRSAKKPEDQIDR